MIFDGFAIGKPSAELLNHNACGFEMLSPLKVLSRGYSIALKNGKAVTDFDKLQINDKITLKFSHGGAKAVITALEKGEQQ